MKILVISQYFYPETFRVNLLCEELVNRGHEVTVLTGYPQYPKGEIYEGYGFKIPYKKQWHGVNIERVKMRPRGKTPLGLLLNCWSFVAEGNKWVKRCKEKYDAVYVFEVSPVTVGLPAVTYTKKFGTPMFFNVQDLWPENVEVVLGIHNKLIIGAINYIVDRIYKHSHKVLCSSHSFVENIANRGVERNKLVFWPQFCTEPDVAQMEKPDVYKNDKFNIVFTGNIGQAQGLDLLLDAAKLLKETPAKWFVVGDGREKERLEKRVAEEALDEQVSFIGRVSEEEANRYIHFADSAYLSFQNNKLFDMTIPAKLQSYLACGTPIIAAAGGESARIVEQNGCGITTKQEPQQLAEAIELLLKQPDDAFAQMRKNAIATHRKFFKKKQLVTQLEELMQNSLEESLKG